MKELIPPEATTGDRVHVLVRSLLSAAPYVGGAAVELFTALITPPLESRRQEWMRDVGERLKELQDNKGIMVEDLSKNDKFIDVVLQVSHSAMRTSQEEKRNALLNAISNSALNIEPDESMRQMFLDMIDSFNEWHLRILRLFQDPRKWAEINNPSFPSRSLGGLDDVLENAYVAMKGKRTFYDQLWRDLHARGLVSTDGLHSMMTAGGALSQRTTELGDRFLRFIEKGF